MSENPRQQKGLEIAARFKLANRNGLWSVPSQSSQKRYQVDPAAGNCSCPDHEFTQLKCKHIFAVEFTIQRETITTTVTDSEGNSTTVTSTSEKVTRKTYRQNWPTYNAAQTNEKAHFLAFLYELCSGIEEPIQTNGRPRLPLADIIFAATYKTYATVSGRRFVSDLRDALAKGYLTKMPSYNSIFDYFKMESLTPYLKHLICGERNAPQINRDRFCG